MNHLHGHFMGSFPDDDGAQMDKDEDVEMKERESTGDKIERFVKWLRNGICKCEGVNKGGCPRYYDAGKLKEDSATPKGHFMSQASLYFMKTWLRHRRKLFESDGKEEGSSKEPPLPFEVMEKVLLVSQHPSSIIGFIDKMFCPIIFKKISWDISKGKFPPLICSTQVHIFLSFPF